MIEISVVVFNEQDPYRFLYRILDGFISTQIAIQPIVDLKTKKVFAHEVLARWDGVPPDRVFSLAEERNVTNVLEKIIVNVIRNKRPKMKGRLFVNTFPTLTDPEVFKSLVNSNVILEITEASKINFRGVKQLRKLGFKLALDDIGTGAATFESLLKMKPNYMKLDKVLTQSCFQEDRDSLLKAFVDHACRIHSKVIVEGIETEEQLNAAIKMGCHYGQGYLLGKPRLVL